MDWQTYKALSDRPDVFSRWMLEASIELLTSDRQKVLLRGALARKPLPKPVDHRGGPATDMFIVAIAIDQLDLIVEEVCNAVTHDRRGAQTQARGLGGFMAAWTEYQRYVCKTNRENLGHGAT